MKKPAKRAAVKPHKRPAKKAAPAHKKAKPHTVKRAAKKAPAKKAARPKRKVGKAKAPATLTCGEAYTPDTIDPRDHVYVAGSNAPAFVDLSQDPAMPPVWDQLDDSCVSHAALALSVYSARADHRGLTLPPDGETGDIREAIGMCADGEYLSVRPCDLQACLSDGMPVVFGLTLFESFISDEAQASGVVDAPPPCDEVRGPHCMVVVGIGYGYEWRDFPRAVPTRRYVKVRNSWGPDAYRDGYLLMPLDYMLSHAADLWTIRSEVRHEVPTDPRRGHGPRDRGGHDSAS